MILASLTRALRTQNWLAVAIEFVIVILGVVIGFQVNTWAQDREAVARAQALTLRLSDDLAMERLNIVDTLTYYAVVMDNAEAVAADLRGDEALADEAFVIAAFRATQFPGFPRFRSAYDELVSTGALPLVEDDGLRRVSGLLYEPGIYNAHLNHDGDNALRKRFRKLAASPVQLALREACGDRFTPAPPGGRESLELDFDCTLAMPVGVVGDVSSVLRADTEFQEAVRQRIADLDTTLNNLNDLLTSMESLTGDRLEVSE